MIQNRRGVLSWCLYDWANSAFVLTVVSGFFPFFFKSYYCGQSIGVVQTTAWLGLANTVAGASIAVLSLVLGALADFLGGKKRFLALFLALGALSTASLFFVAQGAWFAAIALFVLGNIGFSCANLFYDSLLIDVAAEKDMDFVSSMGFAFGYIGGVILFGFCIWMMASPARFGLADEAGAVKLSFLCVAGWWAVFSVPLLLFVRENRRDYPHPAINITVSIVNILVSLRSIGRTFVAIVRNRTILLFLCAYWLYFDGVNTFIRMAVDFGLSIGFKPQALMAALIVVQVIAFPSSLLFGYLSRKVGAGRMIMAGVLIYIAVSSAGVFLMRTEAHFIVLAGVTGVAQGGIQALSRSYFGKLIPWYEATEYFSFYNVVSRLAVVGPMVIGVAAVIARGFGAPDALASRVGMSFVNVFFILGLLFLMWAERARKRSLVH